MSYYTAALQQWIPMFSTPAALAAFASTGLISCAPNVILLLVPSLYKSSGQRNKDDAAVASSSFYTSRWLVLGQAMGAGGLLADVFLHTLPEASHHATMGHDILVGFVIFLAVDLLVRSVNDNHNHHHHLVGGGRSGAHNHNDTNFVNGTAPAHNSPISPLETTKYNRSLILLNLVADALHNFTDGMAIGATYSVSSAVTSTVSNMSVWALLQSHSRGGMATLSILFHEIPHELSDFCTLVRAGYSVRQAILAQLVTALAAFAGTALAIVVTSAATTSSDDNTMTQERLVAWSAGGFLYLSATTILPEVLKEDGQEQQQLHIGNGEKPTSGSANSRTSRLLFRLAQLVAFGTGILFLSMVEMLGGEHHHHHGTSNSHSHHHGSTHREAMVHSQHNDHLHDHHGAEFDDHDHHYDDHDNHDHQYNDHDDHDDNHHNVHDDHDHAHHIHQHDNHDDHDHHHSEL